MKWLNVCLAIVLLTLWLMPSPVSAADPLGFLFPFLKPPADNPSTLEDVVYCGGNKYVVEQEIIEKRTETSKTVYKGNNKYQIIVSGGIAHYKDDYASKTSLWKDIDITPDINGNITKAPYTAIRQNGGILFTDRKTGDSVFISPIKIGNVTCDINAFSINAFNEGIKIQRLIDSDLVSTTSEWTLDVRGKSINVKAEAVDSDGNEVPVNYQIVNGKLTETIPVLEAVDRLGKKKPVKYPIKIDPTVTVQPPSADNLIDRTTPNTNYGTTTAGACARAVGWTDYYRTLMNFTMPSDPGASAINSVKLYQYKYGDVSGYTCPAANVHQLTQTAWTEAGSTWNKYDGVTNWATAGGDFSATIIDTTNDLKTFGNYGWEYWILMGTGSDNPLTLTWGNNIYLIFKYTTDSTDSYTAWYSKNYAVDTTKRPYLIVDYNVLPPTPTTTTNAASSVEETTATFNGTITAITNGTIRGFAWGTTSNSTLPINEEPPASYTSNYTEQGSYSAGVFTYSKTGLTSADRYYYRAYSANASGYGWGGEESFLTKPNEPTGFTCTSNSTAVDLTWTNAAVGAGTTGRTVVRYKTGGYPANTSDGTLSYNGTGTSHVQTGLTDGTPYYFRAWSWAQDGTLDKYSDGYSSCTATPATIQVTTGICTGFLETWAIVHGSFNLGTATQVGFDYGLTSAYGLSKVSSGTYAEGDFQLTLTSLNKATLYHYRAKALVSGGWYYGADRVFATKGSPAEYEYHNTGGDSVGYLTYSGNWTYQTFTTNMTNIPHSVTSVKAKMKRVGSPGDVTMSIKNTSNCTDIPDCYCDPTGADIVSDTLDGDTFSTDFVWYEFTLDTEKCLTANTTYALVLKATSGTNANYVVWERDNVGTYAGGNAGISLNSGVNWIPTCAYDHLFEIWGNPCLSIEQGKVFTTYLEDDDWLITCLYKNTFPPYYDNAEDISSLFYLQLVTTDGATVIAQTRVFDWGYRPGAIYLNADAVDPLEWGDEYYLRMYGNFGDYPYAEYQLQDADWMGDDLARLDSWVRTVAALMEDYYNNTLTTYIAGRGIVLNETGGVIFSTNVPELDKVRPNIFQIVIETPERDSQTFTHAGQDEYVWQTMWGTQMTRVFNLAGATVGLGGETVGALIGFIIYSLVALLAFRPGHAIGAIAIPVPILIIVWGTGLSELALMAILLAVASLLLVWQFWWKGG